MTTNLRLGDGAPDFESATTVLTALPALGNFALTGPEADQLRESLVLPIDPEDLEGEAERDTAAPPVFRPRWFAWRVLASAALVVALGSAAIGLMGVFTGVAAGFVWLLVAVPFAALFWIAGRRGD